VVGSLGLRSATRRGVRTGQINPETSPAALHCNVEVLNEQKTERVVVHAPHDGVR
jgi:hypothetical protein